MGIELFLEDGVVKDILGGGEGNKLHIAFGKGGSGTILEYIGQSPIEEVRGKKVKVLAGSNYFNYGARTLDGNVIADSTSILPDNIMEKGKDLLYNK